MQTLSSTFALSTDAVCLINASKAGICPACVPLVNGGRESSLDGPLHVDYPTSTSDTSTGTRAPSHWIILAIIPPPSLRTGAATNENRSFPSGLRSQQGVRFGPDLRKNPFFGGSDICGANTFGECPVHVELEVRPDTGGGNGRRPWDCRAGRCSPILDAVITNIELGPALFEQVEERGSRPSRVHLLHGHRLQPCELSPSPVPHHCPGSTNTRNQLATGPRNTRSAPPRLCLPFLASNPTKSERLLLLFCSLPRGLAGRQ